MMLWGRESSQSRQPHAKQQHCRGERCSVSFFLTDLKETAAANLIIIEISCLKEIIMSQPGSVHNCSIIQSKTLLHF